MAMPDFDALYDPFLVPPPLKPFARISMQFPSSQLDPSIRPGRQSRTASYSSKEVFKEDPHVVDGYATMSPTTSPSQGDIGSGGTGIHLSQEQQQSPSTFDRTRTHVGIWPRISAQSHRYSTSSTQPRESSRRTLLRETCAEFWGVFVMIFFGSGSVAHVLLSAGRRLGPEGSYGGYQSITWGWAVGTMLGIMVAGDNDACLNPAVAFTNCVLRKLSWRKMSLFLLAQFAAAFLAAGIVYSIYVDDINAFEGHGVRTVAPSATATAGIFATYPLLNMNKATQITSQFIESAVFMMVVLALKDDSHEGRDSLGGPLFPLAMFFVVFGLGAGFGFDSGYAINPTRDFPPRLMSAALGYGRDVWSAGGYYFWIPMIVPFFGCLFGGFLYDVFLYAGTSPVTRPARAVGKLSPFKKRSAFDQSGLRRFPSA